MSAINAWANFLKNEKLDAATLSDEWALRLVELCFELSKKRAPKIDTHVSKMECRRLVCTTAFDMSIDLLKAWKRTHGGRGTKPAIGRGLLDVWNEEYKKRFGGTVGTPGAAEIIRRTVVTKLSKQTREEMYTEIRKCIAEGWTPQQLVDRFEIHLSHAEHLCQQQSSATSAGE